MQRPHLAAVSCKADALKTGDGAVQLADESAGDSKAGAHDVDWRQEALGLATKLLDKKRDCGWEKRKRCVEAILEAVDTQNVVLWRALKGCVS